MTSFSEISEISELTNSSIENAGKSVKNAPINAIRDFLYILNRLDNYSLPSSHTEFYHKYWFCSTNIKNLVIKCNTYGFNEVVGQIVANSNHYVGEQRDGSIIIPPYSIVILR